MPIIALGTEIGIAVSENDIMDECEDFSKTWSYSNLALNNNLTSRGFDDATAWSVAAFGADAEVIYKAGEDRAFTEVSVEITGCNPIIFPVIMWSKDGKEYTPLTTQMTEPAYVDIDSKWTMTERVWDSGAAQYHKKYSITMPIPQMHAGYIKIFLPKEPKHAENLDCLYFRKIQLKTEKLLASNDLTDYCTTNFNNTWLINNLISVDEDVLTAKGYTDDTTVWQIEDVTKQADIIYKAESGKEFYQINCELSECDKIIFPSIFWSSDGVDWKKIHLGPEGEEEQTTYEHAWGLWESGAIPGFNSHWHNRAVADTYIPEGASYVKISFPPNATGKSDRLYVRKISMQMRTQRIYQQSLYKAYSDLFDISVAIEPWHLNMYPALINSQMNVLVTENCLKPWIHSGENTWSWSGTDEMVEYAEAHNMKVRGHTLVSPDFFSAYSDDETKWFFEDENGESLFKVENGSQVPANPEKARALTLKRLENHIKTIMTRYKGKIYAYDVVNEPYKEKGLMRDYALMWRLLGTGDDSWINDCFRWAHEADPDAVLILNDNGFTTDIKKQDVLYNKIKEMRDEGIPVNIGMQMHYNVDVPLEQVENLLKRFSGLCDIYITEFTLESNSTTLVDGNLVLNTSNEQVANREKYTYPEFMREEVDALWAKKYGSLFDLFRKYSDSIKSVGFWGVCNGQTETYSKTHPVLFGVDCEETSAYERVLDFDMSLPRWKEADKLPRVKKFDYTVDHENGKVVVDLSQDHSGPATVGLYTPTDSGKNPLADLTEVEVKEATAENNFCVEFELDAEVDTYTLKVTSGDAVTLDYFYYTPADTEKYGYVINDDFNDYDKIYKKSFVNITSLPIYHGGDLMGIRPDDQDVEDRYIIYKIPENRDVSRVLLNVTTFRGDTNPTLFVSKDGKNFDTAISDSGSWVRGDNDATDAGYYHYIADITNIPSGNKYVMMKFPVGGNPWGMVARDIRIETVAAKDSEIISCTVNYETGKIELFGKLDEYAGIEPELVVSKTIGNNQCFKGSISVGTNGVWSYDLDTESTLDQKAVAWGNEYIAELYNGTVKLGECKFIYQKGYGTNICIDGMPEFFVDKNGDWAQIQAPETGTIKSKVLITNYKPEKEKITIFTAVKRDGRLIDVYLCSKTLQPDESCAFEGIVKQETNDDILELFIFLGDRMGVISEKYVFEKINN